MLFANRIVWVFFMTSVMINEYWQSFDRIGILNHKKVLKKNKLKFLISPLNDPGNSLTKTIKMCLANFAKPKNF